ncbi:ABC-type lipoprotein export system ATPase subunit [Desulfoprunum benzoelyticum]|uniref:ABC-type lipoprotein export system ATPase subunit n=1 Tax=Desulfoprunum benzoelyticum TaxID=1506996 RepID=A0A840UYK1_9BACT|nr:ABC transporter ATP-binding protein [Desulfoprunum benzoelyticum]MBB5346580.1 ABC-type lipoprotein export system ATPase subunit [Desulfoprunum benzoelyticum]
MKTMLLQARKIRKNYVLGGGEIEVVRGIDLDVSAGDFVSIMGTSGSGKSTLLHILGGLARPDSGSYLLGAKDMLTLSDDELSWVRAHWVGFVFQTFDLLAELDVRDNVALPFLYHHALPDDRERRVDAAIDRVGLGHRQRHRPMELSGGEMQRVAIARALVIAPKLILADEPTGNLDTRNSNEILHLFKELNDTGTTIVMVTHDHQVASYSKKIMIMEDGLLSVS